MQRDLKVVAGDLGVEGHLEALRPGWEDSCDSMPSGDVFFLTPAFLSEACRYVGLPQELAELTLATAAEMDSNTALRALAWHAHRRLYVSRERIAEWPVLTNALGERAGLFYVAVVMSGFEQARDIHRERQIPEEIVRHTMYDVERSILVCGRIHNYQGITPTYAGGWLQNHFRGELYRLGRLQYIPRAANDSNAVYRHRHDGRVVVLARDGQEYRRDGHCQGAGGFVDEAGAWVARMKATSTYVIGHAIDPATATAATKPIHLQRKEWKPALLPGDPLLEMHIPGEVPLDFEACGASLTQALEFFPKYFPDKPFNAFRCTSWIFDPQLEQMLPATSNLVRFLSEFYLYPIPSDGWSAVRFIFHVDISHGAGAAVLDGLPRKTRLQRALLEHLAAGGRQRNAGALLFPEDFDWGRQVYRAGR